VAILGIHTLTHDQRPAHNARHHDEPAAGSVHIADRDLRCHHHRLERIRKGRINARGVRQRPGQRPAQPDERPLHEQRRHHGRGGVVDAVGVVGPEREVRVRQTAAAVGCEVLEDGDGGDQVPCGVGEEDDGGDGGHSGMVMGHVCSMSEPSRYKMKLKSIFFGRETVQKMDTASIFQIADKIMQDLGPGYSESIYQNALHRKLARIDNTCIMEKSIPIMYEGDQLGICKADIVMDSHVLEIKAARKMPSGAYKQVGKYMRHLLELDGKIRSGLVINFNQDTEQIDTMEFPSQTTPESLFKRRKITPAMD